MSGCNRITSDLICEDFLQYRGLLPVDQSLSTNFDEWPEFPPCGHIQDQYQSIRWEGGAESSEGRRKRAEREERKQDVLELVRYK